MVFKILIMVLLIKNLDAQDPTKITVDELPLLKDGTLNKRLMPYLGNGHLASTVFDDAIYVNGVYNGERGVSHRARVPNMHDFDIKPSNTSLERKFINKNYTMDFLHGISLCCIISRNYQKTF
jgi:hypothetical protein